jgi:hypothetical protein
MKLSLSEVFELYENNDNSGLSWKGLVLKALSYKDIYISVHDSMEWVVSKSRNLREIVEAVESVDGSTLAFWSTKKATRNMFDKDSEERHKMTYKGMRYWLLGYADIILFNDLDESVSDYTYNDYMELLVSNPNYKEKSYA